MSWAAGLVSSLGSMAGSSGAAGAAGSGATAAGTGTAGATAGAGAAGGGVAGGTAGATGSGSGMFSNILSKAMPNTYQATQANSSPSVMEFAKAVVDDASTLGAAANQFKVNGPHFEAATPQGGYATAADPTMTMQRRKTPTITGYNL